MLPLPAAPACPSPAARPTLLGAAWPGSVGLLSTPLSPHPVQAGSLPKGATLAPFSPFSPFSAPLLLLPLLPLLSPLPPCCTTSFCSLLPHLYDKCCEQPM